MSEPNQIEEFILAENGKEERFPIFKLQMLEMDDGTWRIHVESWDELTTLDKADAWDFHVRLRAAATWVLKAMEHLP